MSTFGSITTTATTTAGRPSAIAPNDYNVPSAGNDGIATLNWSPTANILVSGNWDGGIRCWDVMEQGGAFQANPKAQVNHENNMPVLSTTFSADGSTVFSGGCDKAVRMWQLGQAAPPGNLPQQIGVHDAPVKAVNFLRASNLVVSGGWDRKLKFWDMRQPNPVGVLEMPERVYAMDVRDSLLVVATANRTVITYNVGGAQPQEHSRKESPLKFQTRCISCFPDSTGYAIGSIEGRVGIQYVHKVPGKESFAFKCHRQDANVYSVNAIAFQNQFGTFATVGSDCIVNFWDKDNKQRLKGFNAIQRTISTAAFNTQGQIFAYASSYDWSKGSANLQPGNEIFLHFVPEDEIKQKGKKPSTSSTYKR